MPWQAKYLLLALIWGSSFLLMKVGLRTMAPLQISGLRIYAGTATLLALLAVTGGRLPRERRDLGPPDGVRHLPDGAAVQPLRAWARSGSPRALAGIGNATTPIAALFFALLLLPSDRLSPRKLAAVLVGFVGVVVIIQPWESAGRPDLLGFGMTLVAGACYGLGWTYNRRFLGGADLGGLSMPTALLVVGSVLMVPVAARVVVPAPGHVCRAVERARRPDRRWLADRRCSASWCWASSGPGWPTCSSSTSSVVRVRRSARR